MAWTLHFIVCITAVTASAYKCKHVTSESRLHHDYANQEPVGIPDNRAYERMNVRSAEILPVYSHYPHNPSSDLSTQLREGELTVKRPEIESKVLNWKPKAESRHAEDTETSKIVFPGPTSEDVPPEVSDDCKRLGSCEEVPNYPNDQVNSIVAQLSSTELVPQDRADLPDVPDIAQRVGPQEDNVELCRFDERLMFPKAAVDAHGVWHVVIQDDAKFRQGFKVEICKNVSIDEQTSEIKEGKWEDNSPCSNIAVFVNGYEGRCKQKFVYRNMYVLINGAMEQRSLKMPSCCSCVARLVIS